MTLLKNLYHRFRKSFIPEQFLCKTAGAEQRDAAVSHELEEDVKGFRFQNC